MWQFIFRRIFAEQEDLLAHSMHWEFFNWFEQAKQEWVKNMQETFALKNEIETIVKKETKIHWSIRFWWFVWKQNIIRLKNFIFYGKKELTFQRKYRDRVPQNEENVGGWRILSSKNRKWVQAILRDIAKRVWRSKKKIELWSWSGKTSQACSRRYWQLRN